MRGTKAGFAVAAATLALGACGSSEGAARDAVTGYLGAVADGDGEELCSYLTGDARRELLEGFATQLPEFGPPTCEGIAEALETSIGDDERAMLRDAEVEVEVNGDQATATIVASGQEVPLRKIEGEWLIDGGLFQ